jgi:hypothetical protein
LNVVSLILEGILIEFAIVMDFRNQKTPLHQPEHLRV